MIPILKPRALPERPVVAVVAPASSARWDRLEAGAAALVSRGWQLRWGAHARDRAEPYFSANAAHRLHDLHAAFADPEVDLVICARGGYGSNYLLPELDFELIRANPKPFFAYSDMTVLQTAILDRTGLVSFHGPMLAADFYLKDGVDEASLRSVLEGGMHRYGAVEGLRMLRPGTVEGQLYGGCLSMLTTSLGTPWAPATEGKLLFLEDIAERPYKIDRMLRQLVLAGKLRNVPGIIFGEMQGCQEAGQPDERLEQAILHALEGFEGPIAIGLRSGHVSRANCTLPLGVAARLIAAEDAVELALLEPAVQLPGDMRS